ncbi:phospholipase D-like domain-containing protein [Peredibacter sp. HCB2-198]|uniref:phospholipase D-like domain-containing protein n=1 Tax=Peredibacter sp. HCB2-198 TaxID=3383025 RepID=UPI0038B41F39
MNWPKHIHLTLIALLFACSSALAEEVSLLLNRLQAQSVREQMIMNEKKFLYLNTYLFDLDDFGQKTIGLLVDAARRGVKVTMVVDGIGKGVTYHSAVVEVLKKNGIDVKVYNPKIRHLPEINNRNHQKALIGSEAVIIGDRNMTASYFKRKAPTNYISAEMKITGEAADEARQTFVNLLAKAEVKNPVTIVTNAEIDLATKDVEGWITKAKKEHIKPGKAFTAKPEEVKYIADLPDIKKQAGIHREILKMLNEAKTSIDIMNPYVLLTKEFKDTLEKALDRGVKVRILSNSKVSNDVYLMGVAWDARKEELVKMGIETFELRPKHFIHAKTIVVDNEKVFVGSFNMDPRSQNINLENGVIVKDKGMAEKISTHNTRIQKYFMDKVEVVNPKKLSLKDAVKHCTKKSFYKLITKAFEPVL